jgi:hypothetical protein
VTVSPALSLVNNPNLPGENAFQETLHDNGVVKSVTVLNAFKCGKTPPTIVLTSNKVTAPTAGVSTGVIKYTVGSPPLSTSVSDFTVDTCASGSGSTALTYIATSIPPFLSAFITFANPTLGMLSVSVSTADATLIGNYDLTVQGSLASGEFATFTLKMQVALALVPANIKATFGSPPLIPAVRLNVTATPKRVIEGARGAIDGSMFYMPLIPYPVLPYDLGYTTTYSIAMADPNEGSVPGFIKL